MTRKELKEVRRNAEANGIDFRQGYCCYQDDGLGRWDLIPIGTNYGVYGWNWTLYFCERTRCFYLSGYRNM